MKVYEILANNTVIGVTADGSAYNARMQHKVPDNVSVELRPIWYNQTNGEMTYGGPFLSYVMIGFAGLISLALLTAVVVRWLT